MSFPSQSCVSGMWPLVLLGVLPPCLPPQAPLLHCLLREGHLKKVCLHQPHKVWSVGLEPRLAHPAQQWVSLMSLTKHLIDFSCHRRVFGVFMEMLFKGQNGPVIVLTLPPKIRGVWVVDANFCILPKNHSKTIRAHIAIRLTRPVTSSLTNSESDPCFVNTFYFSLIILIAQM